jgi:hypothetical protein
MVPRAQHTGRLKIRADGQQIYSSIGSRPTRATSDGNIQTSDSIPLFSGDQPFRRRDDMNDGAAKANPPPPPAAPAATHPAGCIKEMQPLELPPPYHQQVAPSACPP